MICSRCNTALQMSGLKIINSNREELDICQDCMFNIFKALIKIDFSNNKCSCDLNTLMTIGCQCSKI